MNKDLQTDLPLVDNFEEIAIHRYPLIDTRAPIEYEKGSFPNSVNLPLMSNEEREKVGTTYKKKGQQEAVKLGYNLVSGEIKESRVKAWVDFIKANSDTHIFCWRGGMRSEIVQQWIYESSGIKVPKLKGGYKAFRNYLMRRSIELGKAKDIYILGGRTGSGKTIILQDIPSSIDLEGIAKHRGSAFGRYAKPQPTQISFENALAYAQIEHNSKDYKALVIEDESRNIGQRYIPHELFEIFQKGRVVIVEVPLERRVDITYDDYVLYAQKEYDEAYKSGLCEYDWYETMLHNFRRIKKRLGNERYDKFIQIFESAWRYQQNSKDPSRHKEWIEALLRDYYDPMYDYQIEKKRERIVFRGSSDEVKAYLNAFG